MNLDGLDAVIFDFDGVLVESVDVKTEAFATLYAGHGEAIVTQVRNYHLQHGGMSRFDKFRYIQTEILGGTPLTKQDTADLAAAFSDLVADRVVAAPMVAGARQFLDRCSGKIPLFIVSGTPTPELRDILTRRHLRAYFAAALGSPRSKAQNIATLLDDHNLCASRCLMIGDAIADQEGAAANSIRFLGRVAVNAERLFGDDVVTFKDFTDLPACWR